MTPEQTLNELQKEVAANPRLVQLLSSHVDHHKLQVAERMGKEHDHITLNRLSESIASITKFHNLITARVPKERT